MQHKQTHSHTHTHTCIQAHIHNDTGTVTMVVKRQNTINRQLRKAMHISLYRARFTHSHTHNHIHTHPCIEGHTWMNNKAKYWHSSFSCHGLADTWKSPEPIYRLTYIRTLIVPTKGHTHSFSRFRVVGFSSIHNVEKLRYG